MKYTYRQGVRKIYRIYRIFATPIVQPDCLISVLFCMHVYLLNQDGLDGPRCQIIIAQFWNLDSLVKFWWINQSQSGDLMLCIKVYLNSYIDKIIKYVFMYDFSLFLKKKILTIHASSYILRIFYSEPIFIVLKKYFLYFYLSRSHLYATECFVSPSIHPIIQLTCWAPITSRSSWFFCLIFFKYS